MINATTLRRRLIAIALAAAAATAAASCSSSASILPDGQGGWSITTSVHLLGSRAALDGHAVEPPK